MKCPTCNLEVTINHERDDTLFLSCGHKAVHNPMPNVAVTWTGFLDGKKIRMNLKDRLIVPAGDMSSVDLWNSNSPEFCNECKSEVAVVSLSFTPDGAVRTHICGHTTVK